MIVLNNCFFGTVFATRSVLCFLLLMMLMLSCILRTAVIATGNYSEIQAHQSAYRIQVAKLRGTIYDCNMVPFTNTDTKNIAAVSPTPKGILKISSVLYGEQLETTLEALKNNKPAICTVDSDIQSEGIVTAKVYLHNPSHLSACHIIGYTDSSGHGVSGLELAYDDFLYSDKGVSAVFTTDGTGGILAGVEPYFENDLSVVNQGVVTTLDINIQTIAETAASLLQSGCAIVAEVGTGKIRACASVPTFDINNLSDSLNAENSPYLNRALSAYSVGSVFKPCVAAAGIEAGYGNHTFMCEGNLEIVDRVFRCHNLSGHGNMNLCSALAQSCNCFFYNFAMTIGGERIYKMASALNFGSKIRIAENLSTASGTIPQLKLLENEGTLANLSIGQGDLLLSPLSMLTLYLAIAGDGSYYLPSVIEKTVKDGIENYYDIGNPTRVMSAQTATTLRQYLETVVTEGTGIEAAPVSCTAAGKTATAQTGRYYDNGEEITNSWFCGFFPAQNPKYVTVIMSDSRSTVSTASVFAKIADEIMQLKEYNVENDD